jgi:hypothetical protein
MGYFETHPWLLIPVIILTVEGWAALKKALQTLLSRELRHD